MEKYTVIYVNPCEGLEPWQFFECFANDDDDAEKQCHNMHPSCAVLWVNTGHGAASQTME